MEKSFFPTKIEERRSCSWEWESDWRWGWIYRETL